MVEKFKIFLAGAPARMKDEAQRDAMINLVTQTLPGVITEWHDPQFGGDVWDNDAEYYSDARQKLSAIHAFQNNCANAGEVLYALKLLSAFLAEEKRKAGLGKTTNKKVGVSSGVGGNGHPALPEVEVLEEGELKDMHISKHERNPNLRKACIEYWRTQHEGMVMCAACGMTFGERYGTIGDGYIEVHHLYPISQIEGQHAVDPKVDLVPLCANCHAMIHRLMTAEKKVNHIVLEGPAALEKLKTCINPGT